MPNYQNIPNSVRYPSGVTANDSVSKVDYNGTSGQTTGPGLLLKVMSGDAVSLGVQCYYVNNTLTTTNSSLNSLAGGIMGTPTGAAEGTIAGYTSSSGTVYSALTNFLGTNDPAPPTGYPKAYLNWILLDDQFNYVSGSSGAVAAASTTYPANQMNTVAPGGPIVMSKNGYLYVWVSNETQGWDVFFDNFSVQYRQGPVLEENHYYPFGLTMAGTSDKAVKTQYATNKYRYNGKELQNQEFSDGSGLEEYDYGARMQDPQLGRFWTIDPMVDKFFPLSPYSYVANNPVLINDPTGKDWSITVDVDKKGTTHFHILFTGAVVDETSDQKGQADKMAKTITSQFESLFNEDKSKDSKNAFTVDAKAEIRAVKSEDDVAENETIFKIEDAHSDDLKYKDDKGHDQYAAGAELNGKEIAISENLVPDAIAGNANKTIPHEIGHLGGLHHPEDDGGFFGWLFNRPGYGLDRSGNNFMFGGGL